jgi:hypothetical protein
MQLVSDGSKSPDDSGDLHFRICKSRRAFRQSSPSFPSYSASFSTLSDSSRLSSAPFPFEYFFSYRRRNFSLPKAHCFKFPNELATIDWRLPACRGEHSCAVPFAQMRYVRQQAYEKSKTCSCATSSCLGTSTHSWELKPCAPMIFISFHPNLLDRP